MEYFVRIVEAIAWPIAVILLVFFFKSEIKKLLPQVKKFKAGPVEAEFERELEEIVEDSQDLIPDMEITQQVVSVNNKLVQLARVDTRSAILEAWRTLEESLKEAIVHKATSPSPNLSSSFKVVKETENMQLLSPKEIKVMNDLRGLRNQAAHLNEFSPSQESAFKYIELAKKIESSAKAMAESGV